jgi:hypothetical protein
MARTTVHVYNIGISGDMNKKLLTGKYKLARTKQGH